MGKYALEEGGYGSICCTTLPGMVKTTISKQGGSNICVQARDGVGAGEGIRGGGKNGILDSLYSGLGIGLKVYRVQCHVIIPLHHCWSDIGIYVGNSTVRTHHYHTTETRSFLPVHGLFLVVL